MSRLFGTDGIRGIANQEPLTPELAHRVGREFAATLVNQLGRPRIRLVIGRDTRLSGPMLEAALVAGALSAGAECVTVGILPTPAIAILTRRLEGDGGVILSASHNPFEDNGIKLFSADGAKIPDAWEAEIEAGVTDQDHGPRPSGGLVGRLAPCGRAERLYVAFLRSCFPLDLHGLTVVLDCAHGATYRVAPHLFRALGARVLTIGARPDGTNINRGCGALDPVRLQKKVGASGADLGLAFDGDGDRLIAVDETGEVRDGDYVLAICARSLKRHGQLKGDQVVTTVMANLGLDRSLAEAGISVVKTKVGDRYVLEEMKRRGANLGGEQSGHLVFLDHAPTGDGLLSALQLLAVMREQGKSLAALSRCVTKVPQVLVNVRVREKPPIEALPGVKAKIEELESAMGGGGRILVRYSGTEPLARVMIEGNDPDRIWEMARELARLIEGAVGVGER